MKNKRIKSLCSFGGIALLLCAFAFACTAEPPPPPDKREPPKVTGPTYHKDVRALLEAKCQGCHQPNNIGPFSLTNYNEVSKIKMAVLDSIESGRMPPWKADNSCNEYLHDFSLNKEQIQLISDWVKAGAPEGDPTAYKPTQTSTLELREDLTIKLPVAYTPKKKGDDYRCFIMDWPKDKETFVTGFRVKADNKAIAHHLIAYAIPPQHIKTFQAFDDADQEPGYACYGGPTGEGSNNIAALTGVGWIGAWAPGRDTNIFPADTGIRIPVGSKVVVQMHYSVAKDNPNPDQSSISFQLAEKVKKEGRMIPFTNPSWVVGKSMEIPAGSNGTTHTYAMDLAANFKAPILIYTGGLHMHTRGKTGLLQIERGEKSTQKDACLLKINQWDFNWQGSYSLIKPQRLEPGDKVRITCTWDNTAEAQPLIDGKKTEPKNLNWGDGTYDEMCLGVMYVTSAD